MSWYRRRNGRADSLPGVAVLFAAAVLGWIVGWGLEAKRPTVISEEANGSVEKI